jgi:hypothetical protein
VKLKFTEHALFRYCQRVLGADVSWLIDSLTEKIGDVPGDGNYKLRGYDAYAVIRDGHAVTVMTAEQLRLLAKSKRKFRFKAIEDDY